MRAAVLFSLTLVIACGGRETTTVTTTNGPQKGKVNVRTIPENEKKKREDAVVRLDQPYFMKKSLLGSKLGADGNVAEEKKTFQKGEPVYLTLLLKDSPVGLQTRATWLRDGDKAELHTEIRAMNGAKTVTFALGDPNLKPGKYRVIGYWGGNVAADKPFEIAAK